MSNESDPLDPTTWRLETPGGIKYRWLSTQGMYEREEADASISILIDSHDLNDLALEVFPDPIFQESIDETSLFIKHPIAYPGIPALKATRLKWKPFVPGLPIDPFNIDEAAPEGTYSRLLEVDIVFENPDYDLTLLIKRSCSVGGEFINPSISGSRWATTPDGTETPGPLKVNRSPILPIVVTIPELNWTVKRVFVPQKHFEDTLLPILRASIGKVNAETMTVLYDAPPETILFDAFSFEETYTWRGTGEDVGQMFMAIELKFIEKNINISETPEFGSLTEVTIGHNHFWQPNIGWTRFYIDNEETPVYRSCDMEAIFRIGAENEDG